MVAMAMPAHQSVSVADYLARERASATRHEFVDGEIVAMSGARVAHIRIVRNVLSALHGQLRGRRCEAFSNDLRVAADPSGRYFYPDVVVVCGRPEFLDGEMDTLLNPTVVIEVLSESTESFDRTTKADAYRAMPSVEQFIVIDSRTSFVESQVRIDERTWTATTYRSADETLPVRDANLILAEIYEGVDDVQTA